MNYIKKLELDNKNLVENINQIRQEIDLLRSYLNSSKFNCGDSLDGYVNVKDVLNRLSYAIVEGV